MDFDRLFKKHGVKTASGPGLQPLSEAELKKVVGGAKDPSWRPGGGDVAKIVPSDRLIHGELRNFRVHPGRQGKHIVGHNSYKVALETGKTPSVFYGTIEDAQELVDKFAGTGKFIDKLKTKERVNFEKIIGKYVKGATGKTMETTWGTIRYSKDGVHIVPSNPDSY